MIDEVNTIHGSVVASFGGEVPPLQLLYVPGEQVDAFERFVEQRGQVPAFLGTNPGQRAHYPEQDAMGVDVPYFRSYGLHSLHDPSEIVASKVASPPSCRPGPGRR